MYKTKNDLPQAKRAEAVKLLSSRLADCIDLRMQAKQAKQAHWNVKGASFIALHELFDKVVDGADEYVDLIAERITQSGYPFSPTSIYMLRSVTCLLLNNALYLEAGGSKWIPTSRNWAASPKEPCAWRQAGLRSPSIPSRSALGWTTSRLSRTPSQLSASLHAGPLMKRGSSETPIRLTFSARFRAV